MTSPRHRISGADEEARTGTCSVCGPVSISKGARYGDRQYWRCGPKINAYMLDRYHSDPDRYQRDPRFQRLYGITVEDYERMLAEQGGVCARCEKEPQEALRLAVDHCHDTGAVRKLLCGPCNTYLGRLAANRDRLMEDLMYLDTGEFGLARLAESGSPVTA